MERRTRPGLGIAAFILTLLLAAAIGPAQAFHFPWDQGHDTTDWEDPDDPGPCEEPDCDPCDSTGSPVYAPTGHLIWTETDIALSGRPELNLTRTYNSFDPRAGTFGNGWTVSCETAMFSVTDGSNADQPSGYILRVPDGKRYEYLVVDDGNGNLTIENPPGRFEQVVPTLENGQPTIHLINLDGSRLVFDDGPQSGRLLRRVDRNGNTVTYSYDPTSHLLSRVADQNNRFMQFTHNASGRVSTITDQGGRTWNYDYDQSGNLVSVTDPLGAVTSYEYRAYQPLGDGHTYYQLTRVTDPTGVILIQASYTGAKVQTYTQEQNTFSYSYNESARTVTKTDSLGRTVTYAYNTRGLIFRETDPLGNSITTDFDDNGRVTQRVEKTGDVWTYTYDVLGRRLTETNPLNETTSWNYAGTYEEPVQITTAGGRIIQYVYDGAGNLISEIDPEGERTDYEYNSQGDLTALIDALGRRSESTYVPIGLPATYTDALGDTTSFAYDVVGNLIQENLPLGRTLRFEYDAQERTTKVVDALNQEEATAYDPAGRLTSITAISGLSTAIAYDQYGRMVSVSVGGATTTFGFDLVGNVVTLTDPEGVTINLQYDALDRLIEIRDGQNHSETYAYDAANKPTRTEKRDASNNIVFSQTYQFDALYRLVTEVRGVGQTTTNVYDANSDLISITGPLGRMSQLAYDAVSRLTRINDAAGGVIDYGYDVVGNLTGVSDPRGLTTNYGLDAVDQLIQLDSPDTGTSAFSYDQVGNLASSTDSRGILVSYGYDLLDRLTGASLPDSSENEMFVYGQSGMEKGRLAGYDDPSGSTRYAYDDRGNTNEKSMDVAGVDYALAYSYDLADRVSRVTYPSGRTVDYTYNNQGKISQISTSGGGSSNTIVQDISYLPYGPFEELTFASGLVHSRTYDQAFRITGISVAGLMAETYQYNAADSLTAIQDALAPTRDQTFDYDPLDRLVQAIGAYGTVLYEHDGVGNRTSQDNNGVITTYNYSLDSNRLISLSTAGVVESFSYDTEGNQTTDDVFQYIYDQAGRLVSIELSGSEIARYLHNANGERVSKSYAGTTTHFVYDEAGLLLGRYDGATGQPVEEFVYLDSMLVAVIRNDQIFLVHTDRLGTPRLVTDSTDTPVWAWHSSPFGETFPDQDVDNDGVPFIFNLRFPGQYYDDETGLHYNYSRDYSPRLGRYIQSDPVGLEGGLNTYNYAFADPINFTDPKGEIAPAVVAAAVAYARCLAECTLIDKLISELTEDCPRDLLDAAGNCTVDCLNPLNWLPGNKIAKAARAAKKAANAAKKAKKAKKARDAANAAKKAAKNAKKGSKGGERAGKDFTKKGKKDVIDENRAKNNGKTVCEHCDRETVPAKKSEKGVTPPDNETQVDHIIPKSKGGDGSPENGQVLCRACNIDKSNN